MISEFVLSEPSVYRLAWIWDTGAGYSIAHVAALLHGIEPCPPVTVTGLGGHALTVTQRGYYHELPVRYAHPL
jgi:hypothetical protein